MPVKITAYTLIIDNDAGARIEISPGRSGDLSIRLSDSATVTASGSRLVSFDDFWNTLADLVGPPGPEPDFEQLIPQKTMRVGRRNKKPPGV